MVNLVIRRLLTLVQVIIRVLGRALCCFRRPRRNSCEPTPLSHVVTDGEGDQVQQWEGWEESASHPARPNPMEEHMRMYRQQRANLNQAQPHDEPPQDFFLDMTPKIIKQKKILLPSEKTEPNSNSQFSLAPDPVFSTADLGVWEENQTWEAQTEGDVDVLDVLREQKRQERERRLQELRNKNERARGKPYYPQTSS